MWSRKDLKEKAKKAFKANYWKSVLVGLILSIVVGSASGTFSSPSSFSSLNRSDESIYDDEFSFDPSDMIEESDDDLSVEEDDDTLTISDGSTSYTVTPDGMTIETEDGTETTEFTETDREGAIAATIVIGAIVFIICLVAIAFGIVIDVFVLNPLELGCSKFFVKNTEEPASLKNIVFAFENGYKNIAKILFFRDLYIVLWSLLFVIPGIIKSYEYRMIPYILADNPNLSRDAAFELSRKMMTGNKWRAFVLDLSFIGWHILSAFTCGILSIFYVSPYVYATNAELYQALKGNMVDGTASVETTIDSTVENA